MSSLVAILLASTALAGEPAQVEVRGYAETRGQITDQDGVPWSATARVRPTLEVASANERLMLTTTVQASATVGRWDTGELVTTLEDQPDYNLVVQAASGGQYQDTVASLEAGSGPVQRERAYPLGSVISVPRLHLDWNTKVADIRVGRQALNWGSAMVYHPTDLFAQVLANRPWEERQGVDGGRINLPIGDKLLLTAAGGFRPGFEDGRAAVRTTAFVGPFDASVIAFTDTEVWGAGIDLKGTAGVGWWIEAAATEHIEAVVGVDYSLPVLYAFTFGFEGIYNGYGGDRSLDPTGQLVFADECDDWYEACAKTSGGSLGDGATGLANTWYADATLHVGFTADLSTTVVAVWGIEDSTGWVYPYATLLAGSHWSFNLGALMFVGKEGEFHPDLSALDPMNIAATIPAEQLEALGLTEPPTMDLSGQTPRVSGQAWIRASF